MLITRNVGKVYFIITTVQYTKSDKNKLGYISTDLQSIKPTLVVYETFTNFDSPDRTDKIYLSSFFKMFQNPCVYVSPLCYHEKC